MSSEQFTLTTEVAFYRERCSGLGHQLEDVNAALDTAKTDFLNLEWQSDEAINSLKAERRERQREPLTTPRTMVAAYCVFVQWILQASDANSNKRRKNPPLLSLTRPFRPRTRALLPPAPRRPPPRSPRHPKLPSPLLVLPRWGSCTTHSKTVPPSPVRRTPPLLVQLHRACPLRTPQPPVV